MNLKNVKQKELDTKEYKLDDLVHMKSYKEPEVSMIIQMKSVLFRSRGSIGI